MVKKATSTKGSVSMRCQDTLTVNPFSVETPEETRNVATMLE